MKHHVVIPGGQKLEVEADKWIVRSGVLLFFKADTAAPQFPNQAFAPGAWITVYPAPLLTTPNMAAVRASLRKPSN